MASSTAGGSGWYKGKVKAVLSGDCLVIMAVAANRVGPPPEKTLTLSSLIAPRLVLPSFLPSLLNCCFPYCLYCFTCFLFLAFIWIGSASVCACVCNWIILFHDHFSLWSASFLCDSFLLIIIQNYEIKKVFAWLWFGWLKTDICLFF